MELPTSEYRITQRDFCLMLDPDGIGPARVTLSIPHDTLEPELFSGLVPKRSAGVHGRDRRVWFVARDIARVVPVQIVRGLLPRGVCDYNRFRPPGISYELDPSLSAQTAFDDEAVAPFWAAYHEAVRLRLYRTHGAGIRPLLMDFHGFGRPAPYGDFDIILGTGNRTTVFSDIDFEFGEWLSTHGYDVFVPREEPMIANQSDYMDADYTTRSIAQDLGFDAVQVEIAHRFRSDDAGERGRRLAIVIADFIRGLS